MVTRQGGYKYVNERTDVDVPFPVAYSKVLSIVGTPVVNASNSSGRGLENIKTYNTTSFVYYSGFDINYKNLLWLSVGGYNEVRSTVTFPISFSNAALGVMATLSQGDQEAAQTWSYTARDFYLYQRYSGRWAHWIAVGF